MIGRVRDRGTFEELRHRGRRVRRGPVTLVHLPAPTPRAAPVHPTSPPPPEPPVRVAYGVGRQVGNAVVRNRLRRRLRSILRELDRAAPPGGPAGGPAACLPAGLAPGAYLVTVRPDAADLPYAELRRHVVDAAAALGRGSSGPPGRGTRR